ncbi:hypothetical protein P5U49_000157 [Neisseria gonorrhoeae]
MKKNRKKVLACLLAANLFAVQPAMAFTNATWMGQIMQHLLTQMSNKMTEIWQKQDASNIFENPLGPYLDSARKYGKEELNILKRAGENVAKCFVTNIVKSAMSGGKGKDARDICIEKFKEEVKGIDTVSVTPIEQSDASKLSAVQSAGHNVNNIFKRTVADGVDLLDPKGTEQLEKELVDSIHAGINRSADQLASQGADGQEARQLLGQYLTMFPIVPIGSEIASGKKDGWFDELEKQQSLITTALVGIRELSVSNQKTLNDGGYFLQAEKYKKYARMQIARQTILSSFDKHTIKSMNTMFHDYVKTPSDEVLGGYDKNGNFIQGRTLSQQQLAQLQIRQMQAMNWNLLEIRRLLMEQNRIGGVQLAISEDGGSQIGNMGGGSGGGYNAKADAKAKPTESMNFNE